MEMLLKFVNAESEFQFQENDIYSVNNDYDTEWTEKGNILDWLLYGLQYHLRQLLHPYLQCPIKFFQLKKL
jgi:hypothetical protein